MDSGNSGSIQSSSAEDEEYDSRVDSITAFGHLSNPQPPPHHHHPNSAIFDPLTNYFDTDSLPNFDPMWAKTLIRPDSPNYTDLLPLPSSSALFTSSSSSPTVPFETTQNDQIQTPVVRNRKKRSRASRGAPTTVLTTDTTNFRAMVQEFTGIPAPPFTSLSSPRTKLDLFGTPSNTRSYPFSDGLQPPPYLLRPYDQKFQAPPFLSPNSNDVGSVNSSGSGSNSNSFTNFQMLTFQSLLQSPFGNSSTLHSSAQCNVDQAVWDGGVVQNDGDQSHQLRSINGNFIDYSHSDTSAANAKMNYQKGSENVTG